MIKLLVVCLFGYVATAIKVITQAELTTLTTNIKTKFDDPTTDIETEWQAMFQAMFDDCFGGSCNGEFHSGTGFGLLRNKVSTWWSDVTVVPQVAGGLPSPQIISFNDFSVLVVNVAFGYFAVNPDQPATSAITNLASNMKFGRVDVAFAFTPLAGLDAISLRSAAVAGQNFLLPTFSFGELKLAFQVAGLDLRDAVALMGARPLSHQSDGADTLPIPNLATHPLATHPMQPLSKPPAFFDNYYYHKLAGRMDARENYFFATGLTPPRWRSINQNAILGNSFEDMQDHVDMSLLVDFHVTANVGPTPLFPFCQNIAIFGVNRPSFNALCMNLLPETAVGLVEEYRDNHVQWMTDFAAAWTKIIEHGEAALYNVAVPFVPDNDDDSLVKRIMLWSFFG